ncbi:hypothetical protein CPB83DRAFT_861669 [Crepidotus variabilis]|uniref:Nephrocystin 3-like N-terminal domain-containing protein n=1 Tax=Crepidotus variabilis TaxID=179855 RepID=A0A9P6JL00_9AGAR|nr:hypothetical protein CPB83DRAFT_861669 [Crepidotus variabilis]
MSFRHKLDGSHSHSISLFGNSDNQHFQDSSFVVTVGNNNIVGDNNVNQTVVISGPTLNWDPIELLLQYCALDALVDAKERFDPPKCAPETRAVILQKIIQWANSDLPSTEFMWLTGSAGSGKSAVCQTIAEALQNDGTLFANFFFSRVAGASGRSNGDRLLPTLIYQMLQKFPETRRHVEKAIRQDRSILTSTRAVQMERLFCSPLKQFSARRLIREKMGKKVRVIIIDGWDECQGTEVQCDLLRILSNAAASMPVPLRFLIASRPEAHIAHLFDQEHSLRAATRHRINLDEDKEARVAISRFVHSKFQDLRQRHPLREYLHSGWPSEDVVELVVSKSSPQFIFASTVMNYIGFPNDRPDLRLNAIVSIADAPPNNPDDPPLENIDKLYRFIFSGVNPKHWSQVRAILAIIHLASREEFTTPTPSSRVLENLFRLLPGMVKIMLTPLLSVIRVPSEREGAIRSLHASLFDFLLDHHRSGYMVLDLVEAHSNLLDYYGSQDLFSDNMSVLSLKGILLHSAVLPTSEERRPTIANIVTATLYKCFKNNNMFLFTHTVAAVELAFTALARYGVYTEERINDTWLDDRLAFHERLPWLPHQPILGPESSFGSLYDNPFTSPLLRAKHCAYVQVTYHRISEARLSALQNVVTTNQSVYDYSTVVLHILTAAFSKNTFDSEMYDQEYFHKLAHLADEPLVVTRLDKDADELSTVCRKSISGFCEALQMQQENPNLGAKVEKIRWMLNQWGGLRDT